ncbi:MAG: hypothetical protein U5N85_13040 [Arcicella sp.]|nr:hypothetical protein [Arcicella sp.]
MPQNYKKMGLWLDNMKKAFYFIFLQKLKQGTFFAYNYPLKAANFK